MFIIRPANTVILLIILAALLVPGFASALTQFENPLDPTGYLEPQFILRRAVDNFITFILGFAAAIAMAVLVYSGLRLILGASLSESEIARAKQMILWAIIGLLVIGLAASILAAIRFILGLGSFIP